MRKFISISIIIMLLFSFSNRINASLIYPIRYKYRIYNLSIYDSYEYVVLGHSHARDSFLMEDDNGILNLGLGGQDLEFQYRMLVKYEEYLTDNTKVLLEFSINSLCNLYTGNEVRYVPLGFDVDELKITNLDYFLETRLPLYGIEKWVLMSQLEHYALKDYS